MITKQQALTADEFHFGDYSDCKRIDGPRGGVKVTSVVYRRNGATQVWVTRPDEFRVPIKYGMREYAQLTELNADEFHTADDCPLNEE